MTRGERVQGPAAAASAGFEPEASDPTRWASAAAPEANGRRNVGRWAAGAGVVEAFAVRALPPPFAAAMVLATIVGLVGFSVCRRTSWPYLRLGFAIRGDNERMWRRRGWAGRSPRTVAEQWRALERIPAATIEGATLLIGLGRLEEAAPIVAALPGRAPEDAVSKAWLEWRLELASVGASDAGAFLEAVERLPDGERRDRYRLRFAFAALRDSLTGIPLPASAARAAVEARPALDWTGRVRLIYELLLPVWWFAASLAIALVALTLAARVLGAAAALAHMG